MMIKIMMNETDNILALEAIGQVTGDDYDSIVIPAIENKVEQQGKIRVLYELGSQFSGFNFAALWKDAKVGFQHLTDFEKIALVSDIQWIRIMTKLIGSIWPCPVKVFQNNQLTQAQEWVTS